MVCSFILSSFLLQNHKKYHARLMQRKTTVRIGPDGRGIADTSGGVRFSCYANTTPSPGLLCLQSAGIVCVCRRSHVFYVFTNDWYLLHV